MQVASLQRTGGLIAALLGVIVVFLGLTYVGGIAASSFQQGFQENVTFTRKDFVPYSERRRCAATPICPRICIEQKCFR